MKKILISLLLFLFMAGCGGGDGTGGGSVLNTVNTVLTAAPQTQIKILKAGDNWNYTGPGSMQSPTKTLNCTVAYIMSIVAVPNNQPTPLAFVVSIIVNASNGRSATNTATIYFTQDAQGNIYSVAQLTNGNLTYFNPAYLAQSGTWAINTSWIANYIDGGVNKQLTTAVMGQEGIATPAGKFNCWKITGTTNSTQGNSTTISWLAPELGAEVRFVSALTLILDNVTYTVNYDILLQSVKIN